MKRLSDKLLVLLCLQLVALVWAFWPSAEPGAEDAQQPLLQVVADEVDRLLISDADGSLEWRRERDLWRMPEYHGLVVDAGLIDRLLSELPGLPRGYPIAGSSGAGQRFEVATDNFQRQLQYFAGERRLAQLFLGTSPGFRRIHARPGPEDTIYSVEFNSYDLPVNSSHWLDKALLQVEQPTAIGGEDFQLQRSAEQWRDEAGTAPDESAMTGLANGLANLRVTGAADAATATLLESTEANAQLSVSTADTSYDYRLYEIEGAHYIRRSDIPVFFALGKFDFDRLNDATADSLFPSAEQEDTTAPENPAGD